MISDEDSPLRKLERELYTVDGITPKKRSLLHETKTDAPTDWDRPSITSFSPRMKKPITATSFFKNLFGVSLVLLIIAFTILGLSLLTGNNNISSKNVSITITAKSFVDGGESLPVAISIVNKNKLPLELATLVLEYPEGSDQDAGTVARITRDVGTIGVGDTHQESFTIQLYGQEGSEKNITAMLQFRVSGSNAVYDSSESSQVVVRTSPIRLTMDPLEKVTPNQEVPLTFTISGNGTNVLPRTAFIMQYPDGFTFTRSTPEPTTDNRVWYLGDIPPGVERKITIYGTFSGTVNDAKTVRAAIGAQNPKNEALLDTTYNSVAQVVALTSAFLDARLKIGGTTGNTVPIGATSQVSVEISWENVTTSQITNAEIRLRLSGSAYDVSKVQPISGFFDTLNNQIIWTKQQQPGLAVIQPGQSGSLSFAISPKTIGLGNVSNPQITMAVDISGFQTGGAKLTASGVDTKKLVINSDLNLIAKTVHYGGQVQNSGPMPPKVNTETTYTMNWQVTNMRNKVSNVVVSTILPLYVNYKSVIIPQNESANIIYNTVTRELIWNVGDVSAGVGGSSPARTVEIKVGITPTAGQVNSIPAITGPITITGKDTFTNADITVNRQAITTQLFNDVSLVGANGLVVQ